LAPTKGTHLYALYEGYNFNVAYLYATGFTAGALASPFTGPLVDKFGRKRSAVAYCVLEIIINALEQYRNIAGLLVSRTVGGVTTNLLFSVFESWVITEHRKRGFPEDKLEIILRDSIVLSNIAAVVSGFVAHILADIFGPTGPFKGAVGSTLIALVLVWSRWEENYGSSDAGQQSVRYIMSKCVRIIPFFVAFNRTADHLISLFSSLLRLIITSRLGCQDHSIKPQDLQDRHHSGLNCWGTSDIYLLVVPCSSPL